MTTPIPDLYRIKALEIAKALRAPDMPSYEDIEIVARGLEGMAKQASTEADDRAANIAAQFALLAHGGVVGARTIKEEKRALLRDLASAIRARA